MEKHEGGINYFLYGAVLSVNLLSFSAGSAYSWTSPVLPKLQSSDENINPFKTPTSILQESCITSLLSFGAAFGPFLAGPLSSKFGRKRTLLVFTVPMIVAYLLLAFGKHVEIYYVARFFLGLGMGCSFCIVPNFVAEIAEDHNRGLAGCFMSFMIACGSLFSYLVGPYVSIQNFCLINLAPLILFNLIFGPFVPESPYFYVGVEDKVKAKNALRRYRKHFSEDVLDKELLSVIETVNLTKFDMGGVTQTLNSIAIRRGFVITIGLMIIQQLSGIGVILAYLEIIVNIFKPTIPTHQSAILVGLVAILTIVFTSQLVDRIGKKNLLMISCSGCFVSMTVFGLFYFVRKNYNHFPDDYDYVPLLGLISYMMAYNTALGPIPWTIMGEVFPPNIKSYASALVSFICLFLSFLITTFYPLLSNYIGLAQCFWIFGFSSLLGTIFVALYVPETRGKSLKEIQYMLEGLG